MVEGLWFIVEGLWFMVEGLGFGVEEGVGLMGGIADGDKLYVAVEP